MELFDKYIGQVIDKRYRLTKIIGSGGMAVVFEAQDLIMKRTVALKLLKDEVAGDPQAVKRFINESKAVSMLSHPNIVSIYDVSVKANLKYIVMERIDGITLKNYINRKGALGYREAMLYAQQILKALEHAHSKGIIHRDIKPQNIMLLKNGLIKVADFGIAKLPNAETVSSPDKAIGTVYYISPEQASGKPIDPRSDLYSLGVVMYEMVTGVLPFRADTPVSVALKQINETPRKPRDYVPNIPLGVEQIILTAMEKHRERRFQSASQMQKSVAQILSNPATVFNQRKLSNTVKQTGIRGFFNSLGAGRDRKEEDEYTSENTPKKNSSMLPMIIGIIVAFVVIIGVIIGLVVKNFSNEKQLSKNITIENYVGQTFDERFKATLEELGYEVTVKEVFDDSIAKGTIISQDPKEGDKRVMIENQQKIEIKFTVSAGKETVDVPDLTNQEYRNAELKFKKIGVKWQYEYLPDDIIAENRIIKTVPAAGEKIEVGSTVVVYISTGVGLKSTSVPSIIGKTAEEANKILGEYQLSMGEITFKESEEKKNTIIEQSHQVGTVVKAGTKINVVMSGGKTVETTSSKEPVEIPNIVGKHMIDDKVTDTLEKLNIPYEIQEEETLKFDEGYVIRTNPIAGTKVASDGKLIVYVAKKPAETKEAQN